MIYRQLNCHELCVLERLSVLCNFHFFESEALTEKELISDIGGLDIRNWPFFWPFS